MSWHRMEDRWLRYIHIRFSWIPLLTSSGSLWFAACIIFILCYIHKKRSAGRRLREWEQQEAAHEHQNVQPPPPALQ
jgi:hypothetical protein